MPLPYARLCVCVQVQNVYSVAAGRAAFFWLWFLAIFIAVSATLCVLNRML